MQLLSDPLKDRVATAVQPPPHRPLSKELLFSQQPQNIPNWKNLKKHLADGGLINKEDVIIIMKEVQKIFSKIYLIKLEQQQCIEAEPSLIQFKDPVNIVGDLHGQFYDLLKILEIGGNPEQTQYLFLGDFVDRGSFSIEILLLAYALKINFPKEIHILRGNHETRQMTEHFNFRKEALFKFDQEIYEIIMETFACIPLAAVINGNTFACHGGISPTLLTMKKINQINRFCEPPNEGAFCDLLWADPYPQEKLTTHIGFSQNEVRGCSCIFGNDAVNQFFQMNSLSMIIRGHEVQQEGFKTYYWQRQDSPSVMTVFSAPNYCDVYNNLGAIIQLSGGKINVIQIQYQQHPYVLPDFVDVFSWSSVFVAEQISNILKNILSYAGKNDPVDDKKYYKMLENQEKQADLANKIQDSGNLVSQVDFIQKLQKRQEKQRAKNEELIKLNGSCTDDKLPRNEIIKNSTSDKKANFNLALKYDILNEKRPVIV